MQHIMLLFQFEHLHFYLHTTFFSIFFGGGEVSLNIVRRNARYRCSELYVYLIFCFFSFSLFYHVGCYINNINAQMNIKNESEILLTYNSRFFPKNFI